MTNFSFVGGISTAPGVQLTSTVFDIVPEPLGNHAVAYMFITPGGDLWDASPDQYVTLDPFVPTICTSLTDYVEKIGGEIPNAILSPAAYTSYKSVESFFNQSGGNGVLYVVLVPITPKVRVTVTDGSSTSFVIQIDGVYFGNATGQLDGDSVEVLEIPTTGIDVADNTYDIVAFLQASEDFNAAYEIVSTDAELLLGQIVISGREVGLVPNVSVFGVPTGGTDYTTLISAGTVVAEVNKRELVFKLNTEETVYPVEATTLVDDYYLGLASPGGEFAYFDTVSSPLSASQMSSLINAYLVNELNLTSTATDVNGVDQPDVVLTKLGNGEDVYVGVYQSSLTETYTGVTTDLSGDSRDFTTDNGATISYWQAADVGGSVNWSIVAAPTLTPRSVQTYALNVNSPSNRFIISTNGATPAQHEAVLLPKLITALGDQADYHQLDPQTATKDNAIETTEGQTVHPGATTANLLLVSSGLYSWDKVVTIEIDSLISYPAYIWGSTTTSGAVEDKFYNFLDDTLSLAASNASADTSDYTFAIRNSLLADNLVPGFILCPEAYVANSTINAPSLTSGERRDNRIAISSALNQIASSRNWLALVDDDPDSTSVPSSAAEFTALVNAVGSPRGHMAFYYPYLVTSDNVTIPASGAVAGVSLARISEQGTPFPGAGTLYPLSGILRPRFAVQQPQLAVNSPRGMNAIINVPGRGIAIYGVRTTATGTPLQFTNSRVVCNVILESLRNSFDDVLFTVLNVDGQAAFDQVRLTAIGILQEAYEQGLLIGATANEAYRVRCDASNNPAANLSQGIIRCDIVFAPVAALERLVITTTITSGGVVSTFFNN